MTRTEGAMPDTVLDSEVEFMKVLNAEYQARSMLTERRFYSIFYSRITPSPIMVLGINPGGDPSTWTMNPDADEFCSAWQHDYVDERYDIQAVMQPLLKRVLGIDDAILRRVPKTNMVFRRSQSVTKFRKQQGGMPMAKALQESIPVVSQIVGRVSPEVIIFEGHDALAMFHQAFGTAPLGPSLVAPVLTPNGRHSALVYAVKEVQCSILPRPVLACALAHPSKYARRVEFLTAEQDMKLRLSHIGARLREMGPPRPVNRGSSKNRSSDGALG